MWYSGRTREVVRRQGARDRTSGGEGKSISLNSRDKSWSPVGVQTKPQSLWACCPGRYTNVQCLGGFYRLPYSCETPLYWNIFAMGRNVFLVSNFCRVVIWPNNVMSKNKPNPSMTPVAFESKLHSVTSEVIHVSMPRKLGGNRACGCVLCPGI